MSKLSDVGLVQDLYFDLREDTESPYIFHRWALLTCMGAALARNVYVSYGSDKIFPNQFCVLLGTAGSRKSTAITQAAGLLRKAGFDKFAGDKTSPEKFIQDLAAGFDNIENEDLGSLANVLYEAGNAKDVLIKASELEDFLGPSNGEFISLLTNLWDNPDDYKHRTKTKDSEKVYRPTINLLGGATPITFQTIFPSNIVGQGMLSRMIVVYAGKARKKIAFPSTPSKELENAIVTELAEMLKLQGEMKLTDDAKTVYNEIYHSFEELDDERLESYSSRRHIHLMKLAIIVAASNRRLHIYPEDLIYANTILSYTENYMSRGLGEFGNTENSKAYTSVLRIIRKHPEGIPAKQLHSSAIEAGIGHTKLSEILVSLTNLKKVEMVNYNGQPVFLAAVKKIKAESKHVDFSVLREFTSSGGKMDGNAEDQHNVSDFQKLFEDKEDDSNESLHLQ